MSTGKHNDHPQTGAPGCSAAREEEMLQLVNDLAENMNLRRWKRADLIECINWHGLLLSEAAQSKANLRMNMLKVITDDMLPNDKVSSGAKNP